ncbi:MAG TPA: nucleotidyltransferase domain-containing protein [Saprospiraceae bacterium]|nr:nucleotidyltransferase domain-containing protein [Saprospiraceae bacterium]
MDLLQLVKNEIKGIDPNAEVILFGSRARGDFREDSDWDFLILLNVHLDQSRKELILEKLYEIELQTDFILSSIIHTKTEWEDRSVTPLYSIIKQEGIRA